MKGKQKGQMRENGCSNKKRAAIMLQQESKDTQGWWSSENH